MLNAYTKEKNSNFSTTRAKYRMLLQGLKFILLWYNIKKFFLIPNCMIDDGFDVMNDVNEPSKSFQNEYSYPTKVVEYLATGKPIVTTAPGELAFYLKDRENAFVADMDDTSTFASKMLEAPQDYDRALKVGILSDYFKPKSIAKIIEDHKLRRRDFGEQI
jgi:hypothetical protein